MHMRLQQSFWLRLAFSGLLTIILINPAFPVFASAQKTVTASAVIVQHRQRNWDFLISGIAREVPVKEGDSVTAGQTLIVLDTPDLEFAVTEAQAALRAAQAEGTVQSYRRVKVKRAGKELYNPAPVEVRQLADERFNKNR